MMIVFHYERRHAYRLIFVMECYQWQQHRYCCCYCDGRETPRRRHGKYQWFHFSPFLYLIIIHFFVIEIDLELDLIWFDFCVDTIQVQVVMNCKIARYFYGLNYINVLALGMVASSNRIVHTCNIHACYGITMFDVDNLAFNVLSLNYLQKIINHIHHIQ